MRQQLLLALGMCALVAVGCDNGEEGGSGEPSAIKVDGSSTVFPITEAVAEEYQKKHRGARVTVGVSGTGGGFKKFCRGETHVSDASRPIAPTEVAMCDKEGIDYIELPVAYDGIAVVVHPDNDWVKQITVDELRTMWEPAAQGKVKRWSQIRDGWPDEELHLYGAGVDSGTYDYFTQAVAGESGASRGDFTSSEDDNVLVQGVSTDKYALGFFGFAYYEENKDKLKVVAVDDGNAGNGQGAIVPSPKTIADGTYQPLSRPLFIYVSKPALDNESVRQFVDFYVDQAAGLAREVGYVGLPDKAYELASRRVEQGVTGSLFAGEGAQVGVSIEDLLAKGVEGGG